MEGSVAEQIGAEKWVREGAKVGRMVRVRDAAKATDENGEIILMRGRCFGDAPSSFGEKAAVKSVSRPLPAARR